jgi:tyrosine-protein kinase Etk/Wzc
VRQELLFLKTRLPEAREQLQAAEDALAEYRKEHRSLDVDTESRAAITRSASIEAELKALQMKRDLLAQQYTPLYPELEKLDAEIGATAALLAQTRRKMRAMPSVGKDMLGLEREVEMRSKLYTSLEQRYQKLKVAEASSLGNVRLIDGAVRPDKPVWPKPSVLVPLAVLAALFVHLAWLFIRSAFSNLVRDAETIEMLSGAPVYVDIPYSSQQRRSSASSKKLLPGTVRKGAVLAVDHPDDFTVETLRGLRAMLGSVLARASNRILMICGPLPRMGKSFVSANLAVLLAEAGKKVLLIDADFQRGRLHRDFGVSNDFGLRTVVVEQVELEDAITPTQIDGLDLLPRGMGEPPYDQVLEQGLMKIAAVLGDYYDHIIVDAPPVLSLSTSAIVGRVAGASIMVVRTDELTVDDMKAAVKRLKLAGVNINGCLVNNMNSESQRQIYRYGYA